MFWNRKKFRIITAPNGNKIKIIPAFVWKGTTYHQIDNVFEMAAGRALCAITFYEELRMRCDYDYLDKHCRAIDILLSDPKTLKITDIAIIHRNLKERIKLAPYPDHIYKLASVLFFDDSEDPYTYDFKYNRKKIKAWMEDSELLPFLVKEPLKTLIPFGNLAGHNLKAFFNLKDLENREHLKHLEEILSTK
jgi:hypothetical protein